MTIRPYHPADYAGCMLAFESNYPEFFAEHEQEEFGTLLKELGEGQADDSSKVYYFVAESEGRVAACAGFYLPPDDAPAGFVWGMVARDFHRKGIGSDLLKFRLSRIRELRPGSAVILDTTQLSFPFFEKMGFRITKITPDFYARGLDRYDMLLDEGPVAGPDSEVTNFAP